MKKDRGEEKQATQPEAGAPDPRQTNIPGTPGFVSIHTMREQYETLRQELDRLDNQIAIRISQNKNKPFAIGGAYYVAKGPKGSKDPTQLRLKEKKPRKQSATAEY